jgi:hypothetical protein
MPLTERPLSADRYSFRGSLSRSEIDSVAANPSVRVLQTSEPATSATWELINQRLVSSRPDIQIRVFGHHGTTCDLSFLRKVGKVQRLSLDGLRDVTAVKDIADLSELRSLAVGIYNLENFDFLKGLDATKLTDISLMATASKKPSLNVLARFAYVTRLYLEGQQKDIEVIEGLKMLEDLTLRSATVKSFGFLKGLRRLWSLDLKLGGSNDLSALAGMSNLKYLELWQVRGLQDLSPIAHATGLQYLFLQSLPQVTELPDFSALMHLRRIYLENMKGLRGVAAIDRAPALEDLIVVSARNLTPDDFRPLLRKKTLKRLITYFGSQTKNVALKLAAQQAGLETEQNPPFVFV